jgi:hypothetical protein
MAGQGQSAVELIDGAQMPTTAAWGTDIQSLIADYDYLPKEADLRTVHSTLR